MKAIVSNVRISPKKLNVIAYIVREMDAKQALDTLRFMPKKGADILYKVIASAVANATHNDGQELENLRIGSVVVTQGVVYRRHNPISRGRAHRIAPDASQAACSSCR